MPRKVTLAVFMLKDFNNTPGSSKIGKKIKKKHFDLFKERCRHEHTY